MFVFANFVRVFCDFILWVPHFPSNFLFVRVIFYFRNFHEPLYLCTFGDIFFPDIFVHFLFAIVNSIICKNVRSVVYISVVQPYFPLPFLSFGLAWRKSNAFLRDVPFLANHFIFIRGVLSFLSRLFQYTIEGFLFVLHLL